MKYFLNITFETDGDFGIKTEKLLDEAIRMCCESYYFSYLIEGKDFDEIETKVTHKLVEISNGLYGNKETVQYIKDIISDVIDGLTYRILCRVWRASGNYDGTMIMLSKFNEL